MKAHLKQAAITVGVVLVGIYVLRRVPFTSNLVNTALNG
jgi:hypothetical protein